MKQTKYVVFKLKKAQHIVELALIAPFIMFFIGIAYQLAITIQANYKFNASLNEAVSFIAGKNKIIQETELDLTEEQLKQKTVDNIKRYARILLIERKLPGNSLNIELLNMGNIDFLIGTYRHSSTFSIFGNVASLNPENYNYLTIIPVNDSILRKNSFEIENDFFEEEYEIISKDAPETEDEEDDTDEDTPSDDEETETTDEDISSPETGTMDIPEAHL